MRQRLVTTLASCVLSVAGLAVIQAPVAQASPVQYPPACNYTSLQPTVRPGDRGVAVKQAQCLLNWTFRTGGPITADGQYGPATLTKVRAFQSFQRLQVDGVVGAKTWAKLYQIYRNYQTP